MDFSLAIAAVLIHPLSVILLGAVQFPSELPRLKELGVGGVITLNETYETLVPTSLYHAKPGWRCSEGNRDSGAVEEQSLGQRVQFVSQTALAKLSYLWLCSHARQKISSDSIVRRAAALRGLISGEVSP
ncbi:hypothetical protein HHK36_000916 [Tetracentron sinense]|uniref:Uncharacterized protein n=1 Tax=Tetracentron sinense TaxID=13715 RepID=A0A834ZSD1_TETSI|nr:hypothetical protein HHK36_000916 [Tetracentron sinense]